jgi:aminoglycoside/choline kinase family phosphotransferase
MSATSLLSSASNPYSIVHSPRIELLNHWLNQLKINPDIVLDLASLAPASSDASFRRYFRIHSKRNSSQSWVVMDAPPPQEDCRPFVQVDDILQETGVLAPIIFAQDVENGFLLLSDFGSTTFLDAIKQQAQEQQAQKIHALYLSAITTLVQLQSSTRATELAPYNRERLLQEMNLFPDWYVARHKQIQLTPTEQESLQDVFNVLLHNIESQAKVLVHRDYHSRNLMVLPQEDRMATPLLGILDFQDALYGPITYDLMSILRDAYVSWDEEQQIDWAIRYWQQSKTQGLPVNADFADFWRDLEWMGLQRHLKVLGIFARLFYRDGKSNYLNDMPVVMNYTRKTAERYREFHPLLKLLDRLEKVAVLEGFSF